MEAFVNVYISQKTLFGCLDSVRKLTEAPGQHFPGLICRVFGFSKGEKKVKKEKEQKRI